jgi:hypothetical protein
LLLKAAKKIPHSADSHLTHSVPSLKAFNPSTADCLRGMVFALCLGAALPAVAQRVQFPSMVDDSGAVATSPPLSPTTPTPTWSVPATPPGAAPPAMAPSSTVPFDPYAPPGAAAPAYGAPPPFSPYGPPPSPYAPYAAPAPYSPYGPSPYSPTPQALYPEGVQTPQILPPGGFDFGQPMRFLQEVRGRFTWLSPMGSHSLGVDDVDTSATFAIPFFRTNAPLLVTPGFSMHFWDGPVTAAPEFADLPAHTYDAYIDGAWHPQITPWLSANLGVRVGAYTDFGTFSTHSIRIMGRGLGIVTFTPTLQFALGIVYIDRLQVKMLPAGGIIWIPNPDARYEILFPNPKLARRWTTIGNTDIWYYVTGEYGGGSWTIQRIAGNDQFDYNDIRVALGLESYGHRGLHGFFEVGYVFDRKIVYRSGTPEFDPSDTVMLRGGLSF